MGLAERARALAEAALVAVLVLAGPALEVLEPEAARLPQGPEVRVPQGLAALGLEPVPQEREPAGPVQDSQAQELEPRERPALEQGLLVQARALAQVRAPLAPELVQAAPEPQARAAIGPQRFARRVNLARSRPADS